MRSLLPAIGICFSLLCSIYTQSLRAEQFKYELLNENDGFSTSIIFSIVQDENGFLWFGTGFDGILRFDGKNVVGFKNNPQNENSLPFDNAGNLLIDQNNKLWIGSWGQGVMTLDLDTQNFAHYPHEDNNKATIASNRVQSVFEDEQGEIWFGTYSGGINKFNKTTNDFTRYPMLYVSIDEIENHRVWDIQAASSNELWVATDLGLKRFNKASGQYTSFLPQAEILTTDANRIRQIVLGSEDQLFLGTQSGVLSFDSELETFTPLPVEGDASIGQVYSMIKTDFNEYWLSSDNGVFAFTEDDLILRKVDLGFDDGCSQTLFQDRQRTIWISCEGVGVYKVVRENTFASFNNTLVKSAFALEASTDDSILVGTAQDGLFRWVPETDQLTQILKNISAEQQTAIMLIKETSKGRIWYASLERLFVIEPSGEVIEQALPDNLINYEISAIEVDEEDNLWISLGQHVFVLAENENYFKPIKIEQNRISTDEPIITQRLYRDNQNRMWISINDSLYLWDKENQLAKSVDYYDANTAANSAETVIYTLYQDSSKRLWIGATSGLFLLDEQKNQYGLFSNYFVENQNRSVRYVNEDEKGNFWLITSTGISQLNTTTKGFRHFDQLDGLPGSRFFHHPTSRSSDGTIYLSSRNGIYYFNPLTIRGKNLDAVTRLIDFEVLGSNIRHDAATLEQSGISLKHYESNIKFEFATLDILHAQQIQYSYMLEGFDEDWIEIGNTNTATYTNLNGGNYVFKVRSNLKDDFYTDELAIDIQIGIPIWQRWYMFAVYAILLAMGIFYYIQRQKRAVIKLERQVAEKTASIAAESKKLEAANKIKSQFLANMSHEIRTPLTTVIGQAEAIICGDVDSSDLHKEVEAIHDSSVYLLAIVNDILDLTQIEQNKLELEYAPHNLHEILKIIDAMFSFQAKVKGLSFRLVKDLPQPLIVKVDALRLKQILINLCSNAVKFTEKGHVELQVSREENTLIFRVKDTGIGLDKTQLKTIFASFTQGDNTIKRRFGGSGLGLHLSNQFAALMNGSIEVDSELGKGSAFTFKMPVKDVSSDVKGLDFMSLSAEPESESLFTGTILLADDHDENRRLIARLLTKLGLTVYIAKDGFEVIESYAQHQPQVIMLDIQMPNMDGIQAYKKLRELGCHHAIIALTANTMSAEVEQYLRLGFDGYIQKPIDRALLIATIAKYYKTQSTDVHAKANNELAMVDMSDLVAKFKSSLESEQTQLSEHWNNRDFASLSLQVHNLSGAAHHFGFAALSAQAIKLEQSIKEQTENMQPVKSDLDKVIEEIKRILSEN